MSKPFDKTSDFQIQSMILVDSNDIDNFINIKCLENSGIKNIVAFNNPSHALQFLQNSSSSHQMILVEIYLPVIDGFDFMVRLQELNLRSNFEQLFFLSASVDPIHFQKAKELDIPIIEKPLTVEKIFNSLNYK